MSKPKTKRCWVIPMISFGGVSVVFKLYTIKPKWNGSVYINETQVVLYENHVPPRIWRMWYKVLGQLNGEEAICECCGETWVPIIEVDCTYFKCEIINGDMEYNCPDCKGTRKIKRPMVEGDL